MNLGTKKRTVALNDLFILKPYAQGMGIRAERRGGLALPGQNLNLIELELLVESTVKGERFPVGSKALIAENLLMTQEWAKQIRKASHIDGEFIIVESKYVTAVDVASD